MAKTIVPDNHFVHCHSHCEYSQFDGMAKLEELVMESRRRGSPAMAVTDHGNMSAAIKFIQYANATRDKDNEPIVYDPIKPIIGMETYLSRKHDVHKQVDKKKGNRHLVLLAKNFAGYQNLCLLSQRAWLDGFYSNPRVDLHMLADHSEGLICSSACLSSVINANLAADRYGEAKKSATILKDIFGADFFLEVQFHGLTEEKHIIPDIFKLSLELDIPIIATNDSHYIHKHQGTSQEVLMCMNQSSCIYNPKRVHFPYNEFHLKSGPEMSEIWGHTPSVLHNTVALAERVDDQDIAKNLFGGMRLPPFQVPDEYAGPQEFLEHLAQEGMKKLGWDKSPEHIKALDKELGDINIVKENNNYDFATYFLIVWDYVKHATENNILTGCGRGSAYASVLLRCLGVTYGPDPIKYGLLWERFLGFDTKRFILESDFGFEEDKDVVRIVTVDADEEDEVII